MASVELVATGTEKLPHVVDQIVASVELVAIGTEQYRAWSTVNG
jgi:hypothetical protein